jgi:hypothetical protein
VDDEANETCAKELDAADDEEEEEDEDEDEDEEEEEEEEADGGNRSDW